MYCDFKHINQPIQIEIKFVFLPNDLKNLIFFS